MATMTLSTSKNDVNIELKGSGTASINWGDGKSNNYALSANAIKCPHLYSGSATRTITITGDITYLMCDQNELKTLDVSNNPSLRTLLCSSNKLTSLALGGLTSITDLRCSNNNLTSLNVTRLTSLTTLLCYTNSLTSLSVTGLTSLVNLYCYNNSLTSLNVTGLTKLQLLHCFSNKLTSLVLGTAPMLTTLSCYNNNLTSLNVSNLPKLSNLSCYTNNLTSLNVAGCTSLAKLYCNNNYLTSLSVTGLSKLTYLSCKQNKFTTAALNNLFNSLPSVPSGTSAELFIKDNPGTAGCNTAVAINKKWTVDYSDTSRRQEINDFLRTKIFSESSIHEAIDLENRTTRTEGKYLVTFERCRRGQESQEFLTSCTKDELYPGMLLVVDNALGTMSPTEAGVPRGKIKINIATFPSSINGGNSREAIANSSGNLEDAVNDQISNMVEAFARSGKSLVADFTDRCEQGMSLDELSMKMSCSAKFAGISMGASFEQNKSAYSTYFMTDYTQRFFTASAEVPKNDLSTLFADSVTVKDLEKAFGNKPIIFVKSVSYGRRLYMLEELSGSNQNMIATFKVSGYGVTFDSSFQKSSSKLQHTSKYYVKGGDITNADTIFGKALSRITDETDVAYCARTMGAIRDKANAFKTAHNYVKLNGTREADVNGVPLSYKASMLCGPNPTKDITFWKSGEYMVKRVIPNTGLKVNVFNTNKDHNIHVTGHYTTFSIVNGVLKESDRILFLNDVRVYNKKFMAPEKTLPKNIYRVFLTIRHRDDSKKVFSYTYVLPCGNILAGYLRSGKKGGETVNWFFGGEDDIWTND